MSAFTYPPLTTTFTPPPQCTTAWFQGDDAGGLLLPRIQLEGSSSVIQCLPNSSKDDLQAGNIYTYSPGYICPVGYSTAGTLGGFTDAVACCPSAYKYSGEICMASSTSAAEAYVGDAVTSAGVILTLSVTSTVTTGFQAIAGPIVLMGNTLVGSSSGSGSSSSSSPSSTASSSPRPSSSSSTSPSASSSPTTEISSATATATSPGPIITQPPANQLSAGAKAGIGVGVALGVLLLAGALGLFLLKRYRRNKLAASADGRGDAPGTAEGGASMTKGGTPATYDNASPHGGADAADAAGGGGGGYVYPKPELDASNEIRRFELDAADTERNVSELEAQDRARELEGGSPLSELDNRQHRPDLSS